MQALVEKLPHILGAIPHRRRQLMLQRVSFIWHRFLYSSHPLFQSSLASYLEWWQVSKNQGVQMKLQAPSGGPGSAQPPSSTHDAFGTVMQWLYHRINATR